MRAISLSARYPFKGWDEHHKPVYDWRFDAWSRPVDFELVRRVAYRADTDSLYLFGYLKGEAIDSWGVVGRHAGMMASARAGGSWPGRKCCR